MEGKKAYSREITNRFIQTMDFIIGSRTFGKVTAKSFGEVVGMPSTNLTRLRNQTGDNYVTIEVLGRACNEYKISGDWLLLGKEPMFSQNTAVKTIEQRVEKNEKDIETLFKTVKKLDSKLK